MDQAKVRQAIEDVLLNQGYEPESRRKEIAFHLTDWLGDLEAWKSYCDSPEQFDSESAEKLIMGFLIHVPNHVAAASKLMLEIPVSDIFEVGAIDADT
jgi:hypothetical protein